MFDLLRTIFSYTLLTIRFISKTGSLASYDYEDDFKLSGHKTFATTTNKAEESNQEITDYEYEDVEAKREELAKKTRDETLTKEEKERLKQYRSGYAKFNDRIDQMFERFPRLGGFVKGASNFFSSKGTVFIFSAITLAFAATALFFVVTAPVSVPALIGLASAGLALNAIFFGKSFVSAVTSDRALQEKKLDYSLTEEIKKEKTALDKKIKDNPVVDLLLTNMHLKAFGHKERQAVSTGKIVAKDLLFEAPSFGLGLASNIITVNVPAIITSLLSTILFRASSIKQSLAAAKSYTEFGNYMAQLEESLGIRNATPEQKAYILGKMRQLNSALDEFLKNPENAKKLEELNKRLEGQKGNISELDSKIKEIDERILKLEEELHGVPKTWDSVNVDAILKHKQIIDARHERHALERKKLEAFNELKNNDDFIELEKALLEAIEKEPFIKPEVKKPSLWESFKRVYNPRNLFSYERNCEMQTPFGADSNFYKACSREEYESDRRQAKDIHMRSLTVEKGKEESEKLPNHVREENVLKELRSQKVRHEKVEAERQKALEKQRSLRAQSKASSTKISTIHTPTRL